MKAFSLARQRHSDAQAIAYQLKKNADRVTDDPSLIEAIQRVDLEAVRQYFQTDLDGMTLPELRRIGVDLELKYLYNRSKADIICDILEARRVRATG